jgi:hypothetical protein
MSTSTESTPATSLPSCKSLVDTIVGLGTSWAAHGLKIGRTALVTSAETLGKTAETLETLAAAFEKKAADAKEQSAPAAADAPSSNDLTGAGDVPADAPAAVTVEA